MSDRFIEELPFFDDEHVRLSRSVANFAAHEVEPRAAGEEEGDAGEHLRELLRLLAQADLLQYSVAAETAAVGAGGQSLDARSLCLVRESLSYSSALADLAFVMQGLGTYPVALAAPEHLREFWLTRARAGRAVAAFALTEPEAGSDVASIQTNARREGDGYVINGHKCFISNAGVADFYTIFARTGTSPDGRAELSAFVVGARMPGLRVSERTRLIAPHPVGEVVFENLRVPLQDRLGEEGDGFRLAMQTMDMFRASVGAAACGMARRALDEALRYAKNRKQFGRPLAEHQLIQSKLALMQTELDAARLLVYRAAYVKDGGAGAAVGRGHLTRTASEAKLFATEAAWRIIDEAVQIHGGNGVRHGSVVERLLRDVRALRIYEGTSEIQKLIIAGQLLRE
ncbi:MAG TPA: acyl-CoA dehydrogenase family protein [Pyrinomonadaceae bacterium]|nr:acyl-CoA dehydrogenase family protein [Pyrinomonadaceae bacterium]